MAVIDIGTELTFSSRFSAVTTNSGTTAPFEAAARAVGFEPVAWAIAEDAESHTPTTSAVVPTKTCLRETFIRLPPLFACPPSEDECPRALHASA
jgi:hypothetical protein